MILLLKAKAVEAASRTMLGAAAIVLVVETCCAQPSHRLWGSSGAKMCCAGSQLLATRALGWRYECSLHDCVIPLFFLLTGQCADSCCLSRDWILEPAYYRHKVARLYAGSDSLHTAQEATSGSFV